MRVLLIPNRRPAYGQDFLDKAIAERCELTLVPCSAEGMSTLGSARQVISQNPDCDDDVCALESLEPGVSVVIHTHCQYSYYSARQRQNIARSVARAAIGITPAHFSTVDMRSRFPQIQWHTVHNGVDAIRFRPTSEAERWRWRMNNGIPPEVPLFAYVGRLEEAKGLGILREFCLNTTGHGIAMLVQFLANGDSAALREYRRIAGELGASAPGQVFPWPDTDLTSDRPIRYCDALVHPSLSEVSPLVVLEALHSGVPVLATNCTPFYEELRDHGIEKRDCTLVEILSPESLARERKDLVLDPTVSRRTAGTLLEWASRTSIRSDAARLRTSSNIKLSKLTSERMLTRLREVYASAI